MENTDLNLQLYQKYLNSKNLSFLHQLIMANESNIKHAILEDSTKLEYSIEDLEDCYHYVYLYLIQHFQSTTNQLSTNDKLYSYMRKCVYYSLQTLANDEKLRESHTIYNGLMKNDIEETKILALDEITLEEQIIEKSEIEIIKQYMDKLTDKQKKVIELYYGINEKQECHTLSEIAKVMNMSTERIKQFKQMAIERIRHYIRINIRNGVWTCTSSTVPKVARKF